MAILINDHQYTAASLQKEAQLQLTLPNPDWLTDIYNFILSWLGESPTIIVHTSGSTGSPKAITLEKQKMIASAEATGKFLQLKPGDKALLCLPVKYIAGKMMIVRAFSLGLNLIWVKPGTNPLKSIQTDIDFTAMVPNQLASSLERLKIVNTLLVGGGPIPAELQKKLQRFSTQIFQTYGMTETITHIAMRRVNQEYYEEAYTLLPGVEVEKDERGCLIIDAPRISSEKVVTNDLVEILSANRFKWLGRHDFVINSGGIKIIPEILEKTIEKILSQRFYLTSIPHHELGEQLVMIVEGKQLSEKKIEDIFHTIKREFSPYHIPKKIFYEKKLKETVSGKIKRTPPGLGT